MVRHAADWGARTIEVGTEPRRRAHDCCQLPAGRGRGPCAADRGAADRPAGLRPRPPARPRPRPARLDGAVPQPGPPPHPRRPGGGRHDADRARRRRQRRVHAQPARRLPVLPGAARRDDRAPRHRSRPAPDGGADGRLDGRRRWARRRRSRRTSTGARRCAGADFVVDTIQVGGASATQIDFDIPAPLRPALHDQRHHQRRRRHARPAHHPGRPRHRARHGGGLSGRLVPQLHQPDGDARARRRRGEPASGRSACATRCSGPSTRSPATSACPATRSTTSPPGVNHLAFMLRLEHRGRDLYPDLRAFVDARRGPRRRPRARRAVPAAGLLPDRVVRAPRRVQPLVHPQGRRRRALPHPDRGVPRRGSRTTSTSTRTPSGGSTPASRSRSSAAASTRR